MYPLRLLGLHIDFSTWTYSVLIGHQDALAELKAPKDNGISRYQESVRTYIKSGGLSIAPTGQVAVAWR